MHAGLIPIVNKETGVAVDTFGIMLPSSTVSDIRNAVHALSAESAAALRTRSESAHAYARAHHTRHRFGEEFRIFVNGLEKNRHA